MARLRVDPVQTRDLPRTPTIHGWSPLRLSSDPASGGGTKLFRIVPGYLGGADHAGEFEYHPGQSENILIEGDIDFGGYYRVAAPVYLNHPPFWVHPAEQRFDPTGDTLLLLRTASKIETSYVPIPDGWDGREFFARETGIPRGVPRISLDAARFEPVLRDGWPSGEEAAVLWIDPASQITAWLLRLPPGWRGDGPPTRSTGSDEMFVLSGDLTTVHDDRPVRLEKGSYYCYPDEVMEGGDQAHSENGFLAIRWTSPVAALTLPEIANGGRL